MISFDHIISLSGGNHSDSLVSITNELTASVIRFTILITSNYSASMIHKIGLVTIKFLYPANTTAGAITNFLNHFSIF